MQQENLYKKIHDNFSTTIEHNHLNVTDIGRCVTFEWYNYRTCNSFDLASVLMNLRKDKKMTE